MTGGAWARRAGVQPDLLECIERADAAIAGLTAKKEADPLPAIEAVAAVNDDARRTLLMGKLAGLRIVGLNKAFIQSRISEYRAVAAEAQMRAADAARRGQLLALDVDGAALLDDICTFARKYHIHTPAQNAVFALAVLNTHCLEAADYCPFIHVTAPEKRCGKTRLLEVAKLLVWSPWLTKRTSAAALVSRLGEGRTLLLDETDAAFQGEREYVAVLRGILDSRFERDSPATLMVAAKGGGWEAKDFQLFGASFIAGIGKLPDTVADRAIPLVLKRKGRGETVARFRKRQVKPEGAPLLGRIQAWAAQHTEALRGAEPALPDALNDRQQDVCEPLLAIADAAGGEWPTRARRALVELCMGDGAEDDSIGVKLLADVEIIFDQRKVERLPSAEMVTALSEIEGSPWAEWGKQQKPITKTRLARELGKFGIKSRDIRDGNDVLKGYLRSDFADTWERYLNPANAKSSGAMRFAATTRALPGEDCDSASATGEARSGSKNAVSTNRDESCNGVAVPTADVWAGATAKPVWAGEEL